MKGGGRNYEEFADACKDGRFFHDPLYCVWLYFCCALYGTLGESLPPPPTDSLTPKPCTATGPGYMGHPRTGTYTVDHPPLFIPFLFAPKKVAPVFGRDRGQRGRKVDNSGRVDIRRGRTSWTVCTEYYASAFVVNVQFPSSRECSSPLQPVPCVIEYRLEGKL